MSAHPYPTIDPESIGWLTTEQMIEVDRIMIEDLHIELMGVVSSRRDTCTC